MNKGLKLLRKGGGPINPNRYWHREPRQRCKACGRRIRGKHHTTGH